jgi:hypothetical protein
VAEEKKRKRQLLTIIKPRKKIGDMKDEERLAFARQIVGATKAKMPPSQTDTTE